MAVIGIKWYGPGCVVLYAMKNVNMQLVVMVRSVWREETLLTMAELKSVGISYGVESVTTNGAVLMPLWYAAILATLDSVSACLESCGTCIAISFFPLYLLPQMPRPFLTHSLAKETQLFILTMWHVLDQN
jgi:hypothetical protein